MLNKLVLIGIFLVSFTSMSMAADSKYAKLSVFDARTNGPVTAATTEINVFVDFIDMTDFAKNTGITQLLIQQSGFYINDLQNNQGSISLLKAGDIPAKGFNPGNFGGEMSIYLGKYSISSYVGSRYFKGGAVIQFNFTTGTNTSNPQAGSLYATETIPFYNER